MAGCAGMCFARCCGAARLDLGFHVAGGRRGVHLVAQRSDRTPEVQPTRTAAHSGNQAMIRKLKSGEYRLYSRKLDPKTHKRRNLGTFSSRAAAETHEREVHYFKRH